MIVVIGMTLITMLAGYGCHEKNTKYESAMQNADSYLKESDFESALGCYDIAAKLEPKSAIPLIKMADIYITQELYEKAEDTIEQAILFAPDSADAYKTKMTLDLKSGKGYDAYDALIHVNECGGASITPEEYLQLGKLLNEQGFTKQALNCLEKVSANDMTLEQKTEYWLILKMAGEDEKITELGLPVAGSEKMPLDFDEKFEEGTFGLTKTQIGEEIFTRGDEVQIISISPNGKYGVFKEKEPTFGFFLYDFEEKKRIDIWADTANSVEGTQETVIQFVKRHEDSLLKDMTWSCDGNYMIVQMRSYMNIRTDKLNDAYIIDAQSGGCRAVKDYEEYVDFVGKIPFYFATTDQTEDIIYYMEYNPSEEIETLVWLNIKTGEDGIITSVNSKKEGRILTDFICATTGQIVYLLGRIDTGKISLVTWKQDNDVWKQVSEIPLNESENWSNSARLFISDSGRVICCTSVETVVFDVNSEECLYAIVGTEEKKQVTFQKATLEEAKKARENSRTFNIGTDCGISPDGKYMVFNRKMYEYDTERTYYNCEFINLDTAQVQEIENPATSNVEDILWLKNGNICLGDGIYSLD